MHPSEENDRTAKIFYIFEIREFETCHIWHLFDKMGKLFLNRFLAGQGFRRNLRSSDGRGFFEQNELGRAGLSWPEPAGAGPSWPELAGAAPRSNRVDFLEIFKKIEIKKFF